MFYLERVVAVIEDEGCREALEALKGVTEAQGIQWKSMRWEGREDVAWEDAEEIPTLWLCDSEKPAKELCGKGLPVLAIFHEGNRGQSFEGISYACEKPWELEIDYLDKIFRRYLRLPWDILTTPRCFVRETVPEDAEAFFEIYSEESITRYTEGLYPELEQEKQYINDYIDKMYSFYNCGVWTVILAETDEIIGRAGFSFRPGFEEPELGYVIGKPWQRRGLAEEVCRAVLAYGFEELGFTQVNAFVQPENEASLALCRKLGMEKISEVELEGKVHVCMRKK